MIDTVQENNVSSDLKMERQYFLVVYVFNLLQFVLQCLLQKAIKLTVLRLLLPE